MIEHGKNVKKRPEAPRQSLSKEEIRCESVT